MGRGAPCIGRRMVFQFDLCSFSKIWRRAIGHHWGRGDKEGISFCKRLNFKLIYVLTWRKWRPVFLKLRKLCFQPRPCPWDALPPLLSFQLLFFRQLFTFEVKSYISLLFCLHFIILGDLIAISKTKTCRKLFFTKVVLCSRAVWVVWEQALGSQWGRQVAQLGAERSLPLKIESPISIHSLLALAMKAGSPLCCHSLLIHNCGLVPAATDSGERVVCGDWTGMPGPGHLV